MTIASTSPRVSVVIPTYNRPQLLRQTLESVARQTYRDFEIIVVDDGSTILGAEEVCRGFEQCRYLRQENAGRSAARNRGMEEARGELIALLDDDDLWKADKLENQCRFLDENKQYKVVHTPVKVIDENGNLTGEVYGANDPERRHGNVFTHAIHMSIVKSPTPLFKKEVITECGGFDVTLQGAEDSEFWTRVSYKCLFGFITEPLAFYRVHSGTHTDHTHYLRSKSYIISQLSRYVHKKDRNMVLRTGCQSYLHLIGRCTKPYSGNRFKHLIKVLQLWPPSVFSKAFVALSIGR